MNGYIFRKSCNEAAFAATIIRVLLKYVAGEDRSFDFYISESLTGRFSFADKYTAASIRLDK